MIILLGYMGCGKSSVGKYLFDNNNLSYCDLDHYIESYENKSIADIFKSKGEIYFRNIEHQYLKDVLEHNAVDVLALGGGTPCYGHNMDVIKLHHTKSFYLKVNLETLSKRLFSQKAQRPLIKDINSEVEIKDFIRKHLFEREFYYRQADVVIDVSDLNIERIAEHILKY